MKIFCGIILSAYVSATLLFTTTLFIMSASAESIYTWTDASGKVHFSSKPINKEAKIANLPQIMRGEVKVPESQLISCKNHSGIDCQAGTDGDGSVICGDGFRESAQRYRFSCSAPKLVISQISDLQNDGTYSIFVRNAKSVAAKEPSVVIRLADGSKTTIPGPKEIEPFGVAEFKFPDLNDKTFTKEKLAMLQKPALENIDLNCHNCPG